MTALLDHEVQTWWEVDCIYEGAQMWGVAPGDTIEEAQASFKATLRHPGHATIVSVKPVPECTGVESMCACPRCNP